jgi:predicted dienelactone hydrolase
MKRRPGTILSLPQAPPTRAQAILAVARTIPAPSKRKNAKATYNTLQPAVEMLVFERGHTVKSAVDALIEAGQWKGSDAEKETLYRSMCYRLRRRRAQEFRGSGVEGLREEEGRA